MNKFESVKKIIALKISGDLSFVLKKQAEPKPDNQFIIFSQF